MNVSRVVRSRAVEEREHASSGARDGHGGSRGGLLRLAVAGKGRRSHDRRLLGGSEASLKAGNEHRLRAERAQLLVCADSSCPADIRKECVRRVDDVNAAIPTILFEVKDGGGNTLSAVRVSMDGEVIAERIEGVALSIDPGDHAFTFEAAGQAPITKHFLIEEMQKGRRESIVVGGGTLVAPTAAASGRVATACDRPLAKHRARRPNEAAVSGRKEFLAWSREVSV
jgi:hypothetical protein